MLTLVPKFDCMTLRPICLSSPDLDETKDELVVAGWGRTQTEERSSLLQVKKNHLSGPNTCPLSLSYICINIILFLPGVELGGGVCETVQG